MAVTGIGQGNAAVYNPFQYGRNDRSNETEAFNEALYGSGAAEQDTKKTAYRSALQIWQDTQCQAANMEEKAREVGNSRLYKMEGRLTSGIIGFGALDDGTVYSARYASDSTVGNPVIEIVMQRKGGREEMYMVSPRNVDPSKASQIEIFALCAYADSQGITDTSTGSSSYHKLLSYAQYGGIGDNGAKTADAFMSTQRDWSSFVTDDRIQKLDGEEKVPAAWGRSLQVLFGRLEQQNGDKAKVEGRSESELWFQAVADTLPEDNGVPYYYMAKDGIIDYNGIVFVCDEEHKALCLGNVSDKSKCLNIPLSGGGSLIVNRDNLDSLAKAIGMFSPEDVNLIMRAIAEDAKIQQMQQQIEDETSGLDLAEETGDGTGETEEAGEMAVAETVLGGSAAGEASAGDKVPGEMAKTKGTVTQKVDKNERDAAF